MVSLMIISMNGFLSIWCEDKKHNWEVSCSWVRRAWHVRQYHGVVDDNFNEWLPVNLVRGQKAQLGGFMFMGSKGMACETISWCR